MIYNNYCKLMQEIYRHKHNKGGKMWLSNNGLLEYFSSILGALIVAITWHQADKRLQKTEGNLLKVKTISNNTLVFIGLFFWTCLGPDIPKFFKIKSLMIDTTEFLLLSLTICTLIWFLCLMYNKKKLFLFLFFSYSGLAVHILIDRLFS